MPISCIRKAEKDDQKQDSIVWVIECERWLKSPIKVDMLYQVEGPGWENLDPNTQDGAIWVDVP